MSDFSFSESGEFEEDIDKHVFRRLERGRETTVGVECAASEVWYELEEKVGDDWIAYQWLGSKDRVNNMLSRRWKTISEIPRVAMATDAPDDVGE